MLQAKESKVKHLKNANIDENIAVSPLTIPILTGTGTTVTAMNFVSGGTYLHIGVVVLIFFDVFDDLYHFSVEQPHRVKNRSKCNFSNRQNNGIDHRYNR